MQMIEEEEKSRLTTSCPGCEKKVELIRKYERLMRLQKKQQLQISSEANSKLSNGKTTSYASEDTSHMISAAKLYHLLERIIKKRYAILWRNIQESMIQKCLLSTMCVISQRVLTKSVFEHLRCEDKENKLIIMKEINQRLRFTLLQSFDQMKRMITSHSQPIHDFLSGSRTNQAILSLEDRFRTLHHRLGLNQNQNKKYLARRNLQLELQNQKIIMENHKLKSLLQESTRRQNRENQKKRESLEMLAQELSQKNDLIYELQITIKKYESKYSLSNNVLEDDIVELKKEVQYLENMKDRLQNQLMKANRRVDNLQEREKQLEEEVQKKEKEGKKIKEKVFELEQRQNLTETHNKSLAHLIHVLKIQFDKLKAYQSQFMKHKRNPEIQAPQQYVNTLGNAKAEVILCFLENINIPDYQIPSLEIFDQEEQQVLINHQINFQRCSLQGKTHPGKRKKDLSQMEYIEYKGKSASGSIFGCMDSPKEHGEKHKNMTIKLLEMQLEKNKQVERISQLKEKTMHIRIIILNLLKSLQLIRGNLSKESEGILEILFDIFQYSEEERNELFVKKKKSFFNLI